MCPYVVVRGWPFLQSVHSVVRWGGRGLQWAEEAEGQRDFTKVQENYEKAVAYYQKAKNEGISDAEMQVLETMMQQVIDGGWLYRD